MLGMSGPPGWVAGSTVMLADAGFQFAVRGGVGNGVLAGLADGGRPVEDAGAVPLVGELGAGRQWAGAEGGRGALGSEAWTMKETCWPSLTVLSAMNCHTGALGPVLMSATGDLVGAAGVVGVEEVDQVPEGDFVGIAGLGEPGVFTGQDFAVERMTLPMALVPLKGSGRLTYMKPAVPGVQA